MLHGTITMPAVRNDPDEIAVVLPSSETSARHLALGVFGVAAATWIIVAAAVLLGACGERVDIEVKARLDGQPAAGAKVVIEREELGVTDAQGMFAKQISRKAGTELEVTVSKEAPGYRIEPWKTSFLVKLPKDGQANKVMSSKVVFCAFQSTKSGPANG